jgi:hypothetical protein
MLTPSALTITGNVALTYIIIGLTYGNKFLNDSGVVNRRYDVLTEVNVVQNAAPPPAI